MRLIILSLLVALVSPASCHSGHEEAACVSDPSSDFQCQVQLTPELSMRYKIILPDEYRFRSFTTAADEGCAACKITVQLLYEGLTWLGIGPSPKGKMIGSKAVIGNPDVSGPKMYLLDGQEIDTIAPLHNLELEDASVEFIEGQTVMEFTASFENWGIRSPVGASLNNLHTFIWAHGDGGTEGFAYHGPNKSSHTLTNLMGFSDEAMELDATALKRARIGSTRAAWAAHGLLAFWTFGVLVPSAIATAVLRDVDAAGYAPAVPGFYKELMDKLSRRWLYIHVGLNAASYMLTLIIFSMAVTTIRAEDHPHFYTAHASMGLVMVIIISYQVAWGFFRPSNENEKENPMDHEGNGEGVVNEADGEGIQNEHSVGVVNNNMATKSPSRKTWEVVHRLLGLGLFFLGMWQMYEGMKLYHGRYGNAGRGTLAGLYVLWMALWMFLIVGGTAYKRFFRGREGGRDDAGVELPQKDRLDDLELVDDDQEF